MATPGVCISQPYSVNLRNQFHQSQTQQIIVFILSPFIYISAIINISFFLRGKKRTQPPADILLFVTIFGLIRITSYLSDSIYDAINPPDTSQQVPSSFKQFCDGTGFMNVMCEVAHFVYNVVFCVYYVVKIRNPLKSWIQDNKQVHVFCLVLIIGATLIFYLTSLIGVSILGVCGYRFGSGSIYIDTILTTSYFLTTLISSMFFLKYLRSISKLQKSTRIYFKYYFKYLIISSIVYLIGVVSLVVITVKCLSDQSDDLFDGLVIVCNVSRLVSPIMVLAVIVGHPQLRLANFYRYFAKLCKMGTTRMNENTYDNNNNRNSSSHPLNLHQPTHRTSFFPQPTTSPKRTSIMIQLTQLNNPFKNQLDYLSRIKDRNKACLLNTILGCLAMQQIQHKQKFSFLTQDIKDFGEEKFTNHQTSIRIEDLRFSAMEFDYNDNEQIYGWNFNQIHQFQLNEEIIFSFSQIFTKKMPTLNLKFISFSSSVFKKLQKRQRLSNLYEKILPSNNEKEILQNVDNDGGRSGMFFFFNFDKTIIIKTITNSELSVLRDRIQAYFNYLESNTQSLIVKILGLYKAINPQTQQEVSFMLMGNILKDIPKRYIIKSYDMKGSTYQRQVLKDKQIRESNSIQTSKTLKDIDFHILQGKVHISQTDSQKIKKIIAQDVAFLCSQKLIDYSLILIKLNFKKLTQQLPEMKLNGLKMYHSTKEQGVVYIVGIIDYLQTWNIRKKGQKWYKSLFNKQESISSQDPQFYAQRFMKSLVAIILP